MNRRYGPHDPEAFRTVTILGPGKFPAEIDVPVPAALVHQRQQINSIAAGVQVDNEWLTFTAALARVAAEHNGRVEWTHVRPLIQAIPHKRHGLLTKRAKRDGLLVEVEITRSKDYAGKNAGRPEPVYELRAA